MNYRLCNHNNDVEIEASGETLDETFATAGNGMVTALCDDWSASGSRYELIVTAEGLEALLFDYLDERIYEHDVLLVLPVESEGTVGLSDGW